MGVVQLVSQALDKITSPLAAKLGLDADGAARLSQAIVPRLLAGAIELPIDIFCTPLSERLIRAGLGATMLGLSFLPKGVGARGKTDLWAMGVHLLMRSATDSVDPDALEEMKGNLFAIKNGVSYGSPESILRGLFKVPKRAPNFAATITELQSVFKQPARPQVQQPRTPTRRPAYTAPQQPTLSPVRAMRQPESTSENLPMF